MGRFSASRCPSLETVRSFLLLPFPPPDPATPDLHDRTPSVPPVYGSSPPKAVRFHRHSWKWKICLFVNESLSGRFPVLPPVFQMSGLDHRGFGVHHFPIGSLLFFLFHLRIPPLRISMRKSDKLIRQTPAAFCGLRGFPAYSPSFS